MLLNSVFFNLSSFFLLFFFAGLGFDEGGGWVRLEGLLGRVSRWSDLGSRFFKKMGWKLVWPRFWVL